MDNAFVFPGQGSQKEGMGKDLYDKSGHARKIFETANDILGYRFSDELFNASEEELMDTRFTQPAIFIYQIASVAGLNNFKPDCVAGHSLGEYAALVTAGALTFEDALKFISYRGEVFHEAYQMRPSAMGAVIGLEEEIILSVLKQVSEADGNDLYIANYNGPGQVVITGERLSIKRACRIFKDMGAKRALLLPMKGVGHSPNSLKEGKILEKELKKLTFHKPDIPIFQDVDGLPHMEADEILENQIKLMTHPVQWTSITINMVKNGVKSFYEVGTDDTLQKIISRMYPGLQVQSVWDCNQYENIKPFNL